MMIQNKKGIALETAVALIMGIVFLITVIYVLLKTGMLGAFQEQLFGTVCTFSSYGRSIFIKMVLDVWNFISGLMEAIMLLVGLGTGVSMMKDTVAKLAVKGLMVAGFTGGYAALGALSFSGLMTSMLILPLISQIPLLCPAVTIDIGNMDQAASQDKVLGELSAGTLDCWNMYGGGDLDPLTGLDPPNPRECRIFEVFLDKPMNVSYIYNYTYSEFNQTWPFSTNKIFVYCTYETGVKLGNTPSGWDGKCSFNKARIYVMFRDKHDYANYGSSVCNHKIGTDDFGDMGDVMVWCIEKM